MMKYIKTTLLLLAITFSVLAAPKSGDYTFHRMTPRDTRSRNHVLRFQNVVCPPVGEMNEFELATLQTTTNMFGCANLGFYEPNIPGPLFHLWVEDPQLVVDYSMDMHGSCQRKEQMDHFMFKCLSKFAPDDKFEYQKGWSYTSLQEYTTDNVYKNVIPTKSYRCAMYHVIDDLETGIRSIRLVISKPVIGEEFDVSQCEGLSALLGREDLPMLPKGMRRWPDGSMLLLLLGKSPDSYDYTPNKPDSEFLLKVLNQTLHH